MNRIPLLAVLMIVSLLAGGCGGGTGPEPVKPVKVNKAGGMFTIDGKPPGQTGDPNSIENPPHMVQIKLYPKGKRITPEDILPTAEVGPDGKFVMSTYNQGDGIPAGEYIITWESLNIAPFGRYRTGPDRFLNNFNNPLEQDPKYSITIKEGQEGNLEFPPMDVKMAELQQKEPSMYATPRGGRKNR